MLELITTLKRKLTNQYNVITVIIIILSLLQIGLLKRNHSPNLRDTPGSKTIIQPTKINASKRHLYVNMT